MSKSFIPRTIALFRAWLLNIFNVIMVQGLLVGQTAGQNAATKALAQTGMDLIDNVAATEAAKKAAVSRLHHWMKDNGVGLSVLKASIQMMKKDPGYTPGIGEVIRVVGTNEHVDPITYKPSGTATAQSDNIVVTFEKHGVDLMSVNYRIAGTSELFHIGNLKDSPYHHHYVSPLVPAPSTVALEYIFIGILHDLEIGNPSDAVLVAYKLPV